MNEGETIADMWKRRAEMFELEVKALRTKSNTPGMSSLEMFLNSELYCHRDDKLQLQAIFLYKEYLRVIENRAKAFESILASFDLHYDNDEIEEIAYSIKYLLEKYPNLRVKEEDENEAC